MTEDTVFVHHDHQRCIAQALSKAQAICASRKLRLTAIRGEILRRIWESHQPTGAYDLLARINKQGRNAAPPTVYRALDFLLENGFIHKIASLNAFIGCICPEDGHQGSFLICQRCHCAQEINRLPLTTAIQKTANEVNFNPGTITLEITGLCSACQASP